MRYWLLALPRKDMKHCIQIGTFGLSRKHLLGNVSVRDKIGCYITKEYKIIALGEATSEYYVDDRKIFLSKEGQFFDRIDFSAELLEIEIDFMEIIEEMKFIKNLAYWSVYFSRGIVEITSHDWNVIQNKSKQIGVAVT